MSPIVYGFPENEALASSLAALLGAELGRLEWHRFPDRESLITLHGDCADRDVVLVCGWHDPDGKALPLYFAAHAARELQARDVGLVAPYLSYMRQDARFRPGQARSAHAFGRFLSSTVDWLITIDPHLHRLHGLDDVFTIPARSLSAMGAVADWVGRNVQNPILIGPDRESAQWAERVAATLSAPWAVLEKVRSGDRNVAVTLPDPALVRDHTPVVIDDIVSSGHTLMEVVSGLCRLGSRPPTCVIVHALFDTDTEVAIRNAGAARIVSTSTVPHASNQIEVAALIAEAVEEMYRARLGKTDIDSSSGA